MSFVRIEREALDGEIRFERQLVAGPITHELQFCVSTMIKSTDNFPANKRSNCGKKKCFPNSLRLGKNEIGRLDKVSFASTEEWGG